MSKWLVIGLALAIVAAHLGLLAVLFGSFYALLRRWFRR